MMLNINTLPSEKNKVKMDLWRKIAVSCDMNIVVETNKDPRHTQESDRTENLTKGWWQKHSASDEYLKEPNQPRKGSNSRQQGGVSMITANSMLEHVCESGGYERELGRWRWITLRGKQGKKTTLIGTYRTEMGWATSNNQLAALRSTEDGAKNLLEPTSLWYSDLKRLIQDKQDKGHNIVLSGDFNDDLTADKSKVQKLTKDLNLREVLLERHGSEQAPKTYEYGSKPIDGIFVSGNIEVEKGGYIDSLDCPGDHCALWIDVKQTDIIGEQQDHTSKKFSRRVTAKIPSVKNAFQELMEEQMKQYNIREKVDTLYEKCIEEVKQFNRVSKESEKEMDNLNDRVTRAKNYADKRCRKLRTGKIPYSKTIQEAMGSCIVLKIIQKRWLLRGKRRRPKTRELKRAMKKFNF